ncbi:MAG TPA: hypothetical protein VGD65_10375 [Chryseosolibacter sp.]
MVYLHLQPSPTIHLQQVLSHWALGLLEQPQLAVVGQPDEPEPEPVPGAGAGAGSSLLQVSIDMQRINIIVKLLTFILF